MKITYFYFSETQARRGHVNTVMVNGKRQAYTECSSLSPYKFLSSPHSNIHDYQYLGMSYRYDGLKFDDPDWERYKPRGGKMKDLKMPTREQLFKAAKKCPDAKDILKELFPDAFEAEWVNISSEVEVRQDSFNIGKGFFIELFWKEGQIGFLTLSEGKNRVEFFKGQESDFKCEGNQDVFKVYARRK